MRKNSYDVNRIILQKIIKWCNVVEDLMIEYNSSYELYLSKMSFQLSCSACVIQIGELTARLSEEFKDQHSEISWHAIKALRNIHAHEYESIKYEIMWKTLTQEIPELKAQLTEILSEEIEK